MTHFEAMFAAHKQRIDELRAIPSDRWTRDDREEEAALLESIRTLSAEGERLWREWARERELRSWPEHLRPAVRGLLGL